MTTLMNNRMHLLHADAFITIVLMDIIPFANRNVTSPFVSKDPRFG